MPPDTYRIIALDLATQVGFATSCLNGSSRTSGSFRLKGDEVEQKVSSLITWLIDFYRVDPFDHLIYEAPIAVSHMIGRTRIETTELLFSLPSCAGAIAIKLGVRPDRIRRAKPNDVRKHFIGQRSAGDRNLTKRAVINRCQQLGFDPADDNEADAIALLDYQRSLLNAKFGSVSGSLFTT